MTGAARLNAAAQGDREALAALASDALEKVLNDCGRAEVWIVEAATFARLAAMHGNVSDMKKLAGILLIQHHMAFDLAGIVLRVGDDDADLDAEYHYASGANLLDEAVSWLNAASDAGSDEAAQYLKILSDTGHHRSVEMAMQIWAAGTETMQ